MRVKIKAETEYIVEDGIYATDVVEGIISAVRTRLTGIGENNITVVAEEIKEE